MHLIAATLDIWIKKAEPLKGNQRTSELLKVNACADRAAATWRRDYEPLNRAWASADYKARAALRVRLNICKAFIRYVFHARIRICELLLSECRRFSLDTGPVLRLKQELQLAWGEQLCSTTPKFGSPDEEGRQAYIEGIKPYIHDGLLPITAFRETIRLLENCLAAGPVRKKPRRRARQVPPLRATAQKAADYIRANPGSLGKDVASALPVSFEHFRRSIVPALKRHGFTNPRGSEGYFPPSQSDAAPM